MIFKICIQTVRPCSFNIVIILKTAAIKVHKRLFNNSLLLKIMKIVISCIIVVVSVARESVLSIVQ